MITLSSVIDFILKHWKAALIAGVILFIAAWITSLRSEVEDLTAELEKARIETVTVRFNLMTCSSALQSQNVQINHWRAESEILRGRIAEAERMADIEAEKPVPESILETDDSDLAIDWLRKAAVK